MKLPFKYSNKTFHISPYTTGQEKELLILTMHDECNLDSALDICGISFEISKDLSREEKILLLLKFRNISVGDEIKIKKTCQHCNKTFDNSIFINEEEIIRHSNIKNDIIIDKFKPLTKENFNEFVSIDINDLDLDEYYKLFKEVDESITKFNFSFEIDCLQCGGTNMIDLNKEDKYIIDFMSNNSLTVLYNDYNYLLFNNYATKHDIDSLLPFEREILSNLFIKSIEEKNKMR